jgi:hypothetical protein
LGIESTLWGEVSETLSEPCPATSTFAFAAFRGAIAKACVFSLLQQNCVYMQKLVYSEVMSSACL